MASFVSGFAKGMAKGYSLVPGGKRKKKDTDAEGKADRSADMTYDDDAPAYKRGGLVKKRVKKPAKGKRK